MIYSLLLSIFCFLLISVESETGLINKKDTKKPNILFICVDDLRPDLGCYGNEFVKTPNIDRLAESGIVFSNHFVQVPTCGASRLSLLTGIFW